MVLCAKIGKCACTLYEQKIPVCIQFVRAYTGIGDAETQNPVDVAETRVFASSVSKAKKVQKACQARHTARIALKPPAT